MSSLSTTSSCWNHVVVFCAVAIGYRLFLAHQEQLLQRREREVLQQVWSSDCSSSSSSDDDNDEDNEENETKQQRRRKTLLESHAGDDAVEELPGRDERNRADNGGASEGLIETSGIGGEEEDGEEYGVFETRKHAEDENQIEAAGPFCYFKMSKYRYSFDQSSDVFKLPEEDLALDSLPSSMKKSESSSSAGSSSPHRRKTSVSASSMVRKVQAVPEDAPMTSSKQQNNNDNTNNNTAKMNGGGQTTTTTTTTKPQGIHRSLARSNYNARILPSKVILIRHGQSLGNITENAYCKTADNSIPLTDLGWEQARMAGKAIKDSIIAQGESVRFVVSPYVRTMETFHGLVSAWSDPNQDFGHITESHQRKEAWYQHLKDIGVTFNEDPRIREQDFGNYQDADQMKISKEERHQFGLFYYRFAHGESASDVYDRVSTFLDSLWRSFDIGRHQNYVLVTHGISIRVFLARYFRYSVDEFTSIANPRNCEMVILEHDGKGRLRLQGRCELTTATVSTAEEEEKKGGGCFRTTSNHHHHHHHNKKKQQRVTGYKMHQKLREVPEARARFRNIRLSVDDQPTPIR